MDCLEVLITVKLTSAEREMLEGTKGPLKQQALKKVVEYANVLGAEELCEVTKAHIFCGLHSYLTAYSENLDDLSDIEQTLSQMHLCSDEKIKFEPFACYCQSDVGPMDPISYEDMDISPKKAAVNQKYLDFYKNMGVNMAGTCVPYLSGFLPLQGEHYVTSESHVVPLLNGFFGAAGNSDGLEAGFWSAICGRTPKWGNHIKENRKGTHLFKVDFPVETSEEWDLLGYDIGRKLPTHSVPVIYGDKLKVDIVTLKYFFAAMCTTSGPEMCHIVGHTPEAPTLEAAFGGKTDYPVINVIKRDLVDSFWILSDKVLADKNGGDELTYISLGCPHYSMDEMRLIANYMKGKKKADKVIVHVWTAHQMKEVAERSGIADDIKAFGAKLLTSSCPLTSGYFPKEAGTSILFDSAKQAHYIRPITKAGIFYRNLELCIDAAVIGKLEEHKPLDS